LKKSHEGDILVRKTKGSIEDIAQRIEKASSKESIDVDMVVAEAVEWARRSK
jgi:hypothetical protein